MADKPIKLTEPLPEDLLMALGRAPTSPVHGLPAQPYANPLDLMKGMVSGLAGAPGDLQEFASGFDAPLLNNPVLNPVGYGMVPEWAAGPTSKQVGERLGADTGSPEFFLGTIGAPDASDFGPIVAKAAKVLGDASPMLAQLFWHGSPVKKLVGDNFALKYIDTGEGQQARGYGLYFGERQETGQTYFDVLGGYELKVGDKLVAQKDLLQMPDTEAAVYNMAMKGKLDTFLTRTSRKLRKLESELSVDGVDMGLSENQEKFAQMQDLTEMLSLGRNLKDQGTEVVKGGSLFRVDIPDEVVDEFVDLEGYMYDQPKKVQQAFETFDGFAPDEIFRYDGEDAYRTLSMRLAAREQPNMLVGIGSGDGTGYRAVTASELADAAPEQWYRLKDDTKKKIQKLGSEYLLERGVDGMKFRDAGSRHIPRGISALGKLKEEPTFNLVVFNPEVIQRIDNMTTGKVVRDVTR